MGNPIKKLKKVDADIISRFESEEDIQNKLDNTLHGEIGYLNSFLTNKKHYGDYEFKTNTLRPKDLKILSVTELLPIRKYILRILHFILQALELIRDDSVEIIHDDKIAIKITKQELKDFNKKIRKFIVQSAPKLNKIKSKIKEIISDVEDYEDYWKNNTSKINKGRRLWGKNYQDMIILDIFSDFFKHEKEENEELLGIIKNLHKAIYLYSESLKENKEQAA